MSKRNRTCVYSGKIIYSDEVKAYEAAGSIYGKKRLVLIVYRCRKCSKWHLANPKIRSI